MNLTEAEDLVIRRITGNVSGSIQVFNLCYQLKRDDTYQLFQKLNDIGVNDNRFWVIHKELCYQNIHQTISVFEKLITEDPETVMVDSNIHGLVNVMRFIREWPV